LPNRYRFVSDNEGNNYLIPLNKTKEFEKLSDEVYLYWQNPEKGIEKGYASEFPEWVKGIDGIGSYSFENPTLEQNK
jgi:hypothetical protein